MQSNLAEANVFASLLANRSRYDLDLSQSTFIEVIEHYQTFKRKTRPSYTLESLIYNLKRVEVMGGRRLRPDDITDIFYSTFSAWLTKNGVRYNSQKQYLSQIKACLTWGTRHHCPVSSTFDVFDLPKQEPFTIALTPDEVSHIAHFDIDTLKCRSHHKKTLEKVRDHFVLSCNLGQRYSDMVRVSPENFERNIFSCTQKKTASRARLDIDRLSITPALTYKLLKKYGGFAPWQGDITNFNHYLHELIKAIGGPFAEDYKIENKINGVMQVEYKKKYELIASHTARRTFVTYNAHRNVPIAEVMRATGHKSINTFSGYIKFND